MFEDNKKDFENALDALRKLAEGIAEDDSELYRAIDNVIIEYEDHFKEDIEEMKSDIRTSIDDLTETINHLEDLRDRM